MKIVAMVSDHFFDRLHQCAPRYCGMERVRYANLESALSREPVGIVVLDPVALSERAFVAAVSLVKNSGTRLVLYADHDAPITERVLAANKLMTAEVVLKAIDDDVAVLRSILSSPHDSIPAQVLHGIGERLRRMPPDICRSTLELFSWMPVPQTVGGFATGLDRSPNEINVVYRRVGVCSLHQMLLVARMARLFSSLGDSTGKLDTAARAHGLGTIRSLERQTRLCFGMSPLRVAKELNGIAYARGLIEVVMKGRDDA
jgi:hypothetical protein